MKAIHLFTDGAHDAVIGYTIVVAHQELSQMSTADTSSVVASEKSLPFTDGEHDPMIRYTIVVAHQEVSQRSTADTSSVVADKSDSPFH
jgi:hypothetical protein